MGKRGALLLWISLILASSMFILFVVLIVTDVPMIDEPVNAGETAEKPAVLLSPENETSGEGNESENFVATVCGDYLNETDCINDSFKLGCLWDVNSSACVDEPVAPEKPVSNGSIDLSAINLTLASNDCDFIFNNVTNVTEDNCGINITATLKNSGESSLSSGFVVHLLDITDINEGGTLLIELYTINETITSGQTKTLTKIYDEFNTTGKKWVKFIVDATGILEEIDEDNNAITKTVEVY
jgi:hypothetical protein